MRRFYYPSIPDVGQNICLDIQSSHHLLRVVGISKEEEVEIFDGKGKASIAILQDVQKKKATLQITRSVETQPNTDVQYWLLVALVRPEPFGNLLRMATEIGVHHIVPFQSSRSLHRSEKSERWENIVLSAVQQCGRYDIPKIYPLQSFSDALETIAHIDQKWIFHPSDSEIQLDDNKERLDVASSIEQDQKEQAIVIGPEGGFEREEIQLALKKKCMHKVLGRFILRTDTAVAVTMAHIKFGSV